MKSFAVIKKKISLPDFESGIDTDISQVIDVYLKTLLGNTLISKQFQNNDDLKSNLVWSEILENQDDGFYLIEYRQDNVILKNIKIYLIESNKATRQAKRGGVFYGIEEDVPFLWNDDNRFIKNE